MGLGEGSVTWRELDALRKAYRKLVARYSRESSRGMHSNAAAIWDDLKKLEEKISRIDREITNF